MNHLYLLRHAKASWELAGELDYERGLTERGQADAAEMRGIVAELATPPKLVICSGARRARETLDAVAEALPRDARVEYDDRIYKQGQDSLLELAREIEPSVDAALIVGHNPAMHDFAVELAAAGDQLVELAGKFPTAALAVLSFECAWSELAADAAELVALSRARAAGLDD
jgi:phosphohistidine phosphatase